MRYEDRRLQEAIYPYSLNPQMRAVLLSRYIDIEQDYETERNAIYPANGRDSVYENVDVKTVPTIVLDALLRIESIDIERGVLRTTIANAGYAVNSTSTYVLRERTKAELDAVRLDKEQKTRDISSRRETRLKALREVARKLQGQIISTVRVKMDAAVLADLDAI